jgi:23S rRNA (guanine745-N1)-methyltransferase
MTCCLDVFVCPVCKQQLIPDGHTLKCRNMHNFDISAGGYVNLIMSGREGAGDNSAMIAARHAFLQQEYYACLKLSLASFCADISVTCGVGETSIVDAGCGEGYYTAGILGEIVSRGVSVRAAGLDISKPAIKTAAKRRLNIAFAVASLFELPIGDCCTDIVLNIFAPLCASEFKRVLKPGGSLIIAAPGKRHLYGLKEVLYDRPYENDKNVFELEGFGSAEIIRVNDVITLKSKQDIESLFAMTPYYWKTPLEGAKRLGKLEKLTTEIEFELHVLKKK